MENIRILRDDIRSKGWHITAFDFQYNSHKYVVLFEDAKELGCKEKYTIAFLTFIDQNDEARTLSVSANTKGFDSASAREIMDYFRIGREASPKGFFPGFYEFFNSKVPNAYVPPATKRIRDLTAIQLGKRNRDPDPNALYCYDVRRNPVVDGVQRHRTIFNSNKARLLRETLYERLKDDNTLSFFFSPNPESCLPDVEILKNLASREKR